MPADPITILIPTCNRGDVLGDALATCHAQRDVEGRTVFLVSDNASEDATPEVIQRAARRDPRVRSIRTSQRLGMADHWEFALDHVSEGWVGIIGDDDGLLPRAIASLRAAMRQHPDIEAICWPYSFYIYPDEQKPWVSGLMGLATKPAGELCDGLAWLARLADFRSAWYGELPRVYHGLVHTRLLERIRAITGRRCLTRIPDVSLAVAVAASCGRFLKLPLAASLFGSSKHSTGAASQGVGNDEIYSRFERDSRTPVDLGLPRLRSVSSMVLEAILAARETGLLSGSISIDLETALTRIFFENAALPLPDDASRVAEFAERLGLREHHAFLKAIDASEQQREQLLARLAATGYTPRHDYLKQILPERAAGISAAVRIAHREHRRIRPETLPPGTRRSLAVRWRRLRSDVSKTAGQLARWRGRDPSTPPIRPHRFARKYPKLYAPRRGWDDSRNLQSQLCRYGTLDSPTFRDWAARLHERWRPHRKLWELAFICQALAERGLLAAGQRGLGFAVGTEKLPAVFAAAGCEITATDLDSSDERRRPWADTGQWAESLDALNAHGLCDERVFRERVEFRPVDMNFIPQDLTGYDFTWSTCSFEHCGSLDLGLNFLERQMACLKPGGFAVHTTEFNLSSNEETLATGPCVIYRLRDIEEICHRLGEAGHEVAPLDVDPGHRPLDRHIDTLPYCDWDSEASKTIKHLRLNLAGYASTSIALIIRKAA